MDFAQFIRDIQADPEYAGQIVDWRTIPARPARFADLARPLPPALRLAIEAQGLERFYAHQAEAIDLARDGHNVVIVAATASGKTLCYNVPILEAFLEGRPDLELVPPGEEPGRSGGRPTALYLFPTKALAQDQLRALARLRHAGLQDVLDPGIYDGDVARGARSKVRDRCNLILSNPDMLHRAILPHHTRWAAFLGGLRYIVIDEVHVYRGIFGTNTGFVLRRLQRLCRHYGSDPQYICCSATIRNPLAHAESLTGKSMTLVDDDGSPQGAKHFLLWNPPRLEEDPTQRRSSNMEAQALFVRLMRAGVRTIVFGKARIVAELIARYTQEALAETDRELAAKVAAYRGGYLPAERREIERRLFEGELQGITSTSALELGIDVGSLEACLTVGFPETIAGVWQQAGRVGRASDESLVILIAYTDPRDQHLMQHPEYLFGQSPESATIDPENPYVLAGHLRCAAAELPLGADDAAFFGEYTPALCELLAEHGEVRKAGGRYYWASSEYPAGDINLRTSAADTYSIVDVTRGNQPIGAIDGISGLEIIHPGAVYLHEAQTYLVEECDLEAKVAYVVPAAVDYYTQAGLINEITVEAPEQEADWRGQQIALSDAIVRWQVPGFSRIRFYSLESLGFQPLDLPPQQLETVAFWFVPGPELLAAADEIGRRANNGLTGIRNVAVNVLPTLAMCERLDIGGLVDSKPLGRPAIFLYDRYHGGLGFVERAFKYTEELMAGCLALIEACDCEEGCPLCVGLPAHRPDIHGDPDPWGGYDVPDKAAALAILRRAFGRE